MKKQEAEIRNRMLKVRVNDAEMSLLKKLQAQTTERDVSSYIRRAALQKPVTVLYRNRSADDFLREMLPLKKELAAIGNNVNQAVHKLHILDKIPEFRSWLMEYEGLKKLLMNKVEEIRLRMNQLYEQWLQR